MKCKFCNSNNVIKWGKQKGKQAYFCKDCKRKFIDNGNIEKMRTDLKIIAFAMDTYFEGLSVRKVQRQIAKIYGVKVNSSTIWRWIMKYSQIVDEYVNTVSSEVLSGVWHVDETVIKCDDRKRWFWEVMDEESKFILASHFSDNRTTEDSIKLFMKAKRKTTQRPEEICVDGSYSYIKGFKKAFWSRYKDRKVKFTRRVGIRARKTNNIIERFHSTLKMRLKTTRGLGEFRTVSSLLKGFIVHYNYVRIHSVIGTTPAVKAGMNINVRGWEDLIQKATNYKNTKR